MTSLWDIAIYGTGRGVYESGGKFHGGYENAKKCKKQIGLICSLKYIKFMTCAFFHYIILCQGNMVAGCSGRFMRIPVRVIIKNIRKSVSGQGMRNGNTRLCQ